MIVKFCGMRRERDVEAALSLGVDLVGFILAPSRRQVEWTALPALAARAGRRWVAVLVDPPADDLARLRDLGCPMVQLHGHEPPQFCHEVGFPVIKAVRPGQEAEYRVAHLLYDAPQAGSGQPWAWEQLKPPAGRSWFLAGGLEPDNVQDAIETLRPSGVDVASGIELEAGVKCPDKMRRFLEAVRKSSVC